MGSHHRVFELSTQVSRIIESAASSLCAYNSVDDRRAYRLLLDVLDPFGTMGQDGPHVG